MNVDELIAVARETRDYPTRGEKAKLLFPPVPVRFIGSTKIRQALAVDKTNPAEEKVQLDSGNWFLAIRLELLPLDPRTEK